MKHDMSSIALLPTGFVDFMPEEAETEAAAIQRLMDLFSSVRLGFLAIHAGITRFCNFPSFVPESPEGDFSPSNAFDDVFPNN